VDGLARFSGRGCYRKRVEYENKVDVLTHGPIHEAFAETVAFDPEPGIVVPKAPPDAIEEIPPEQKPEGDVEWIPGYWAWDDDRNDFIWVSGIWRVIPPDRQWVPGYWFKSQNGFQWVSGYWALNQVSDTEYLPEPPESVEVGPNVNAPSPDYSWIPGCWVWYSGRYAWRPGYWAAMQPDWVWVPAHYVWTPRGYIFVGGYWDVAVAHRGILFAPVYFPLSIFMPRGYYFTPVYTIDLRVFSDCLFLRPRYHHYYFGDYYAPKYYRKGIYPWFSPHVKRYGYDPIYAHQRWEHRKDRGWERRMQTEYQKRRNFVEARPPRKLNVVGTPVRKAPLSKAGSPKLGAPFPPVTKIDRSPTKFQPLSRTERTRIDQRGKEVRSYTRQRQRLETQTPEKAPVITSGKTAPNTVKLPKSPISAKTTPTVDVKKAPPTRYKTPKLNPSVEPLQRKSTQYPGRSSAGKPFDAGRSGTPAPAPKVPTNSRPSAPEVKPPTGSRTPTPDVRLPSSQGHGNPFGR
jgi:hypothetical protein